MPLGDRAALQQEACYSRGKTHVKGAKPLWQWPSLGFIPVPKAQEALGSPCTRLQAAHALSLMVGDDSKSKGRYLHSPGCPQHPPPKYFKIYSVSIGLLNPLTQLPRAGRNRILFLNGNVTILLTCKKKKTPQKFTIRYVCAASLFFSFYKATKDIKYRTSKDHMKRMSGSIKI